MAQSDRIYFVTWPDGKVDEESINIYGERIAKEKFVAAFLPARWFGAEVSGYVADTLWRAAERNGFRLHTIVIPSRPEGDGV